MGNKSMWDLIATQENLALFLSMLTSLVSYYITKFVLIKGIYRLAGRWDHHIRRILEKNHTFHQLLYLIPSIILYSGIHHYSHIPNLFTRLLNGYIIITITFLLGKLLTSYSDIYNLKPVAKKRPIKGLIQLFTLFIYLIGAVVAMCILMDKSPLAFLSGIGALTALLLLVFRDTILSFIAGMQLLANNLIQKGDWIDVPSFGASGSVVDVALHIIEVQNWDQAIVTIPTYKLMETGFKNWRGMYEAGVRRIKRSILIDQTSIKFLDDQLFKAIKGNERLAHYLERHPQKPLDQAFDDRTNLGLFRFYVESYLKSSLYITNEDFTFLIRLLAPTPQGVPLEVYAFYKDTAWVSYEQAQSSIFEHLFAILPFFELEVYQSPSGKDVAHVLEGAKQLTSSQEKSEKRQHQAKTKPERLPLKT